MVVGLGVEVLADWQSAAGWRRLPTSRTWLFGFLKFDGCISRILPAVDELNVVAHEMPAVAHVFGSFDGQIHFLTGHGYGTVLNVGDVLRVAEARRRIHLLTAGEDHPGSGVGREDAMESYNEVLRTLLQREEGRHLVGEHIE